MKILCVMDNLSAVSGVSTIVMGIYRNISPQTMHMDFLICNKQRDSYESEILANEGKVYYTGNFLSPKHILSAIKNSKKFFAEHGKEYDIVHLHSPTIGMFTLKYAKKYGVPVRIVHSHSSMSSVNKIKAVINRFLMDRSKKYANEFFTCSPEASRFLYGDRFCAEHNVEMVYNAVDCSKFTYDKEVAKATRHRLGVEGNTVFLHVSNYSPIKNHVFLLDVIEQFSREGKKVKFVFVGNGPTRQSFEDELTNRGIKDLCVFVDKTSDVAQYLYAADAILLPSLKEGLPLTLVEGQAAGLPFFSSDTVTREVLVADGEFIPLDSNKWYDSLSALVPLTPDERASASEKFKESKFNIEIEAARVADLYEKLAKGAKKQ